MLSTLIISTSAVVSVLILVMAPEMPAAARVLRRPKPQPCRIYAFPQERMRPGTSPGIDR